MYPLASLVLPPPMLCLVMCFAIAFPTNPPLSCAVRRMSRRAIDPDAEHAAAVANAAQFIKELPEGFFTQVCARASSSSRYYNFDWCDVGAEKCVKCMNN